MNLSILWPLFNAASGAKTVHYGENRLTSEGLGPSVILPSTVSMICEILESKKSLIKPIFFVLFCFVFLCQMEINSASWAKLLSLLIQCNMHKSALKGTIKMSVMIIQNNDILGVILEFAWKTLSPMQV